MKKINFFALFILFIFNIPVEGRELCEVYQSMTYRSTLDTYSPEEKYINITKETLISPPRVLFQHPDGKISEKSTFTKFRNLLSEAFLDDEPKLLFSKVTDTEGEFVFETDNNISINEHAFLIKVRGSEIDIYRYHPLEGTTGSLSIMQQAIKKCNY
ncbi:hypothetical protein [Pseudoalteromonas sp. Z9A5]|uniref:hypothetical protein n=1 Tax=Pseudoalteromonas sp. Z9A5 TaxID=2686355 RepID=UPI00140A192B|nr:hypothetical protein [Pseudoalteromonas sp. Z9A5]